MTNRIKKFESIPVMRRGEMGEYGKGSYHKQIAICILDGYIGRVREEEQPALYIIENSNRCIPHIQWKMNELLDKFRHGL